MATSFFFLSIALESILDIYYLVHPSADALLPGEFQMNVQYVNNNRDFINHILEGGKIWLIAVETREDEVACRPTIYGQQGDVVAMDPIRDPDELCGQMEILEFLEVFGDFATNIQYTEAFLRRRRSIRPGKHLVTITDGSAMTTRRADEYKTIHFDLDALEDVLDDLNV